MWEACEAIRDILLELGPSIDGGKDSLSMAAKVNGETAISPGEVTMTVYAPCSDITKTVTPDLKLYDSGALYYIDLSGVLGHDDTEASVARYPLGGTALSTVYNQLGDACSDVRDVQLLKRAFNLIQSLLDERLIISGHDRSDGGLIVCLLEMAFAGNCGLDIQIPSSGSESPDQRSIIEYLFHEGLGLVIEILPQNMTHIESLFREARVPCLHIGRVLSRNGDITISCSGQQVLHDSVASLRDIWESTSFALELLQCNEDCVRQERQSLLTRTGPIYRVVSGGELPHISLSTLSQLTNKPKVAILRQEGTNGDREMASAFYSVGFEVWDVNMNDLLSKNITLDQFRGIVFCGGFSYADVNGSAKGWAATIRYHSDLNDQFEQFKNRPDTFSLGVCNGCQLMALLGWVPFNNSQGFCPPNHQPRFLHNESNRFESRWCSVRIQSSPSLFFHNMDDSVLGIWVQHGEGRLTFPDPTHLETIRSSNLIPLSFVDDDCSPTERYPMNPNGSPLGIAGLCSEDGRHLAMMPHPERCYLKWQWPYQPIEWKNGQSAEIRGGGIEASPWIQLFQNAYNFCQRKVAGEE
jgi:phosphoribosylformylglycinamidine synthase